MKAVEAKLLGFLKKSPQFVIPIYQRIYSWSEEECLQLWEDILRTGKNDAITAHFVGSIVYVEKGLYSVSSQTPLLVIDGQQRLTTITLLIEALSRVIGEGEPLEGFSSKKLRNYYLLNPLEEGDKKYKLILSQTDRETLTALLDQVPEPKDPSLRVKANFEFFANKIADEKDNLKAICSGLAKLIIVDISLNRDQDNPQLIFESLNSTGRELSQADLIRNFILMGLEHELQSKLYSQYWRPMELDFGQEAYSTYFDSFMRHYLTVKTGNIPKESDVYEVFKKYSRSPEVSNVETLVSDIHSFSKYYCAMALGAENDPEIKLALQDLRELKVDVAFPLLLELYKDYDNKVLSSGDFLQILRLIESYVFRRAICDIPTNSMNKTFATFSRNIDRNNYLEGVLANFLLLPSYRRFPDDAEFKDKFRLKDIYNFRSRSYWLRRLENYDRKERVPVDEFTIEHIMPQNENLSSEWRKELGEDWERIQKTYLHTLGNLTLTGYNSEYSDKPFKEKRDMKGGFKESPLRLNKDFANKDNWREGDILNRAEVLSIQAISVWASPKLEYAVLDKYKPKVEMTEYSIESHPHLMAEPMKNLFQEFRKQVLALDPCVSETFLKLYVAYKAETNFVDVVPQAKRLRLMLNIAFPEINDPKGICKDVTDLGRWGNGDVEVGLSKTEDLSYVMGLVRQAFEKQMGQDGDE
ncbi:MAG: hypothetical protein UT43_C0002G0009 [Parcubacteria group bacterium GW2011_GWC1_39_29]|nr:MAG: hypothetical protein UT43_C0002G0009 [Parcubacteria group bacterium GW2011_GWC1_39_29]